MSGKVRCSCLLARFDSTMAAMVAAATSDKVRFQRSASAPLPEYSGGQGEGEGERKERKISGFRLVSSVFLPFRLRRTALGLR